MPLASAPTMINNVSWSLSSANTLGNVTQQGASNFTGTPTNITTWNQLLAVTYAMAAAGTQTVNLNSFTNLVNEAVTALHVLWLFININPGEVTLQPGASNPIAWFFTGGGTAAQNALTIGHTSTGGQFLVSELAAGPGYTISSTVKNIDLKNNGSGANSVTVVALVSTT